MAIRADALWELIRRLWKRGIPVCGWLIVEHESGMHFLILLSERGHWAGIALERLATRLDVIVEELAAALPSYQVLETPMNPQEVPQISEREWAWWRFLRWEVEQRQRAMVGRHAASETSWVN